MSYHVFRKKVEDSLPEPVRTEYRSRIGKVDFENRKLATIRKILIDLRHEYGKNSLTKTMRPPKEYLNEEISAVNNQKKGKEWEQNKSFKKKLKCFHCKKIGHTKAQCWELHGYPSSETKGGKDGSQKEPPKAKRKFKK